MMDSKHYFPTCPISMESFLKTLKCEEGKRLIVSKTKIVIPVVKT